MRRNEETGLFHFVCDCCQSVSLTGYACVAYHGDMVSPLPSQLASPTNAGIRCSSIHKPEDSDGRSMVSGTYTRDLGRSLFPQ